MIITLYHGPRDRTHISVDDPTTLPKELRFVSSTTAIRPGDVEMWVQFHIYTLYTYGASGRHTYQYHYVRQTEPEPIPIPQTGDNPHLSDEFTASVEKHASFAPETAEYVEPVAESAQSGIVEQKRGRGRPRKTPVTV